MQEKPIKKVLFVFGTRPEAIKMCPLVQEFLKNRDTFRTIVCVTAQHREMLDQVLDFFGIEPEYDLEIMKPNQDLYDITANVLLKLRDVVSKESPDFVFVHGDTTTTFSASLAAFYQQIPVCHIEAGLRTGNIYSPWPEEANRKLTTQIVKYNFTPTQLSKNNLLDENVNKESIFVTGNTIVDALFWVLNKIEQDQSLKGNILTKLAKSFADTKFDLRLLNDPLHKFILVTGHRRENFGDGFQNICKALKKIAISNPEISIIYPVHLNPNVIKPVKAILSEINNVYLIEPLDYETFIYLMNSSYIILTDSGGIQEEAPSLGKPVLVMRDTTERPEAVDLGIIKLVGTKKEKIINEVTLLLENKRLYQEMAKAKNPYGDGKACKKIVDYLKKQI